MDQHALVCAVKDMALELGRTPTRDEFIKRHSREHVNMAFGSYAALVQAAGLVSPKKIKLNRAGLGNEIFEQDIGEVLKSYKPREIVAPTKYTPTAILPDTHFPFVSQRVLDAFYAFIEKEKPSRVIQIGDLYDLYCHSRFPRSHNVYMPKQEEELARKGAEDMWKTIRSIAPTAECIQMRGNHDTRPLKQTLAMLPALEHVVIKYLDELMTFEGVKLITDPRQEYIVDGIEFIHGYRSQLGSHRDYALMNAVCGHIHVGGVVFRRIRGQTLFELNAGLAGDPESKALSYTSQKISNWTPGFGYIDFYGPRFIPVG